MNIKLNKDLIFTSFNFIIDEIQEIDVDDYFESLCECSGSDIEDKELKHIYSLIDEYKQSSYFQLNRSDLLKELKNLGNFWSYDIFFKVKKNIFKVFDLIDKKKTKEDFFKTHFVNYCQVLINLSENIYECEQKIEIVKAIFYICNKNKIIIYKRYNRLYETIWKKFDEFLNENSVKNNLEVLTIFNRYKELFSRNAIESDIKKEYLNRM